VRVREPPESLPQAPAIARRLALAASRSSHAVVIGDASGCVEWVNAAFSRITGHAPADVLGKRLDLLDADAETRADAAAYVRSRLARGETSHLEIPTRTKSGRSLWLALEIQPLPGEDGAGAGWLALAADVTERKHAERALAESEERHRQLVELSPLPIAAHCDGRIVFLNPVAARLLGAGSPHELLGQPVMDVVHPDDREAVAERVRKILETGAPSAPSEVRVLRRDGRAVEVEITGARISHQGRPAVQLVAQDLSTRRRAESERRLAAARAREAQHAESLATLARGVGHDFNNLLGTILGEVDLALARPTEDEDLAESLRSIRRESLRAANLTAQLLAYAGKGTFTQSRLDLSRLVMQSSELLEATVAKRALLSFDVAGNLPRVLGDPVQLRQVLLHLVQNAAEAVDGRAGTITVRTRAVEERPPGAPAPVRSVHLEVADTGCGMDRETVSRVFDPFFTTKFTGRGLGLSASRGIVHAHKGTLSIASREGRGTTVTVELPCAASAAPVRRRRRRPILPRGARSVLVVDDEEGLRRVAQRVLEREGFAVQVARDGVEALRLFRAKSAEIGVVLLDLTMPRMGGAEALREMRRVQPDVRVILMTGYADATEDLRVDDLAGFLAKPYEPKQLVETVRRALGS
jgi:PAS domain S-box-containing protein